MRIAIGGIAHETNTYVRQPTTLDDFTVRRGDGLLAGEAVGALSGLVGGTVEAGAEPLPLLHAWANPWGVIEQATYDRLKTELLDRLADAGAVDLVALDLHGAGVTEDLDDLEADLVGEVRALVGGNVVVVATHDLHGNVSQAEADALDLLFCCEQYPHDDLDERGREAINAGLRVVRGELHPVIHVEPLPLIMPTTTTYHGVGAQINARLRALEGRPGVIDVTLQHGFPYADTPLVRSTVLCTTDGDRDLAAAVGKEGATEVWRRRHDLLVHHPEPTEAVARALAIEGEPVVINETSDNPGGGAPADGTHLLRALLDASPERSVFCGIKDPEVVRQATAAGVGSTIDVLLGGKTDDLHGEPVPLRVTVEAITGGRVTLEAEMGRGWVIDYGPTALLVTEAGLEIIVISIGFQTIDRTLALAHGIDVTKRRIVALKSSNHFRSGFEELAAGIVTTDPPGLTSFRVDVFDRSRTPRPAFPLDPEAIYGASRP